MRTRTLRGRRPLGAGKRALGICSGGHRCRRLLEHDQERVTLRPAFRRAVPAERLAKDRVVALDDLGEQAAGPRSWTSRVEPSMSENRKVTVPVGSTPSAMAASIRPGTSDPKVSATIPLVSLLLLVDLDGVVYRGAEPVPGVAEVLAARAAAGDDVVYVTNNSMHYRADYVTRLAGMGAPVTPDTVVSSARATALYLAEQDPPIRRVLVLGAGGLEREARDVGMEVVTAAHAATRMQQEGIDGYAAAGEPDAVLVGLDPNLTYLRLAAAADCVRAGARFIATNRDPVYPTERGIRPGAGAIVAAVESTTGVTPISIGKPAPRLLEIAAHAVGRDPREAIMVGDGILTDLAAANALGARCVFMLTGVSTREQLRALAPGDQPVAVAEDAAQLAAALETLAAEQATAAAPA